MGIITHSDYNFHSLQIKDAYICISSNPIYIFLDKKVNLYNIVVLYDVYVNYDARLNGEQPFQSIQRTYKDELVSSNLYTYAYDKLKQEYPVYSDA